MSAHASDDLAVWRFIFLEPAISFSVFILIVQDALMFGSRSSRLPQVCFLGLEDSRDASKSTQSAGAGGKG